MSQVTVIGGGAAGMMAAIAAAEAGHTVRILEKNEKLGKKLFITGKGRCNLTNACDTEELFDHVVSNPRFLYSSFYGFTNRDVMDFVEKGGCPLKTERGNRVFPASDKSSDVIRVFVKRLQELGVQISLHTEVSDVLSEQGSVSGVRLKKDGQMILTDAVIVATGGLSYPSTGSTGDGYRFARSLGHTVTELSPALVPFEVREPVAGQLQGLSLRNIRVQIRNRSRLLYEAFGEMLFTHFGVSGPVLLSASSYVAGSLKREPLILSIDLKPALSREQLDARVLRDFEEERNKRFRNSLTHLLPSKLIPVIVAACGIDPDKRVNEVTRAERERLVSCMKDFRLTLSGLRDFKEAIVTQGGVSVKEINPSTMESKKISGLYFAGEVLDLDAVTGGFNLQIAWSTGRLAGASV
ncbi:MAG: NAD(P)/FAD-dependent oxidoreductase [Clostridiales bacterium]|nr:NAD(P)/FAD-dependent oxidoreductase [Clostridiales bacterium]